MTNLKARAWLSLGFLAIVMDFCCSYRLERSTYWQAWVYLTIFFGSAALTTIYVIRRDPALLERRMRGGPVAENRAAQKIMLPFFLWRLFDEERLLRETLPGYAEYQQKVRHRLLPGIW